MEKHQVLTVLVADDEPELLGAVCQLIDWESLGFRLVGRAGNGLDALQLVEALQPDFLLTDIRMPFISGTALTRQAKAVQPLLHLFIQRNTNKHYRKHNRCQHRHGNREYHRRAGVYGKRHYNRAENHER